MSTAREDRVFLIGIAAELAGMHPQTLRVYERRGLITPRRTARNTRVYSEADVALLRRIQELSEEGLNLAGIERVLRLEQRLERAERRARDLRAEIDRMTEDHRAAVAEARASRGQIVLAGRRGTALVPRYQPVVTRNHTRRIT
jgi:MerR family transcriptional regulator/heat shock protein HspR